MARTIDEIAAEQAKQLGPALLDLISGAAEAEERFSQEELEVGAWPKKLPSSK